MATSGEKQMAIDTKRRCIASDKAKSPPGSSRHRHGERRVGGRASDGIDNHATNKWTAASSPTRQSRSDSPFRHGAVAAPAWPPEGVLQQRAGVPALLHSVDRRIRDLRHRPETTTININNHNRVSRKPGQVQTAVPRSHCGRSSDRSAAAGPSDVAEHSASRARPSVENGRLEPALARLGLWGGLGWGWRGGR
jgi:hypothetical protein